MGNPTKYLDHITVNGIDADIVTDGYRLGENLFTGPWREVIYAVPFEDAPNFIDALMGLVRPKGHAGGGAKYTTPHRFPKNEVLVCIDAHAEPLGVPKPGYYLLSADECHITARYEVPRIDFAGNQGDHAPGGQAIPWTTWNVTGRTRMVPVTKDAIQTEAGEAPAKDQPRRVHVEEMRLVYHWVPYMYLPILRSLSKRVNLNTFLDWPKGQCLFDGYTCERNQSSDGTTVQTIALEFLGQDHDWNSVPKDDDLGYVVATGASGGTDNFMYPYIDLSPLLKLV